MATRGFSPLSVLVTNFTLAGRTGTEIVTRDLCTGLTARGHRPMVYTSASQANGPIAAQLRDAGVPIFTQIEQVPDAIDVIHAHHTPVAAAALCRFPNVPAVFVAHDYVAWYDSPPLFPSVARYAAVDTTVAERVATETGWAPDRIDVILNSVDMARFRPGPPLPARPRRALAFAKNHGHVDAIANACRARQIELDVVGQAVGKVVAAPEDILGEYDLVFTSALSALEAMACGRAVIVCDGRGLAGYVTCERAARWRPQNFGLRCLTRPVEANAVMAELDAYDPQQSARVSAYIRDHADRERWLDQLETIYGAIRAAHIPPAPATIALATAKHIETWSPKLDNSWPWVRERAALIEENERLKRLDDAPSVGIRYAWRDAIAASWIAVPQGFGDPEDWGSWTIADRAGAVLKLPHVPRGHDLSIKLEFKPHAPTDCPPLGITLSLNGQAVATRDFNAGQNCQPTSLAVRVPAPLPGSRRANLAIEIRNARAPSDFGASPDTRKLGIGLTGLTYSVAPRPSRLKRHLDRWTRPSRSTKALV